MTNSIKITLLSLGLFFILSIPVSAQEVNECDKIREECDKISKECYELEAQNREAFDKCEKIREAHSMCDAEYEKIMPIREGPQIETGPVPCDPAPIQEYKKCHDERLAKYGTTDCWKRYNECLARYQACLDKNIQPKDLGISKLGIAKAKDLVISKLGIAKSGFLPDNPFYFLETISEGIGTFFTFGDLKKAERYAALAAERVAEAQVVVEKGKPEVAEKALKRYEDQLNKSLAQVEKAKAKGIKIEKITQTLAEATSQHLTVLEGVLEKVPENVKEKITKAKEVSIAGQKNALRALSGENPARATEINLKAAEARLNRARVKTEEGKIEEVEEAIKEFENQHKFGEEISQIAQGLGKDMTTVEQLVGKATSIHLEILAKVYEKVPEQAKPAIEKAMEVSVKGHEKAVQVLEEKGALEEVPEVVPMPVEVPIEVKERVEKKVKEEIEKEELEKKEVEEPKVEKPGLEKPETEKVKEKILEKIEAQPLIKPIESIKPPIKPTEPTACIQVITPAIGPDNVCKEFPTPCEVPEGWKKIDKCPSVSIPPPPPPPPPPSPPPTPISILTPTPSVLYTAIVPAADAEVRQFMPTTNLGSEKVMYVAPWGENLDSRQHRTFVKFSLVPLPVGATVQSATLNLYHSNFYGAGTGTYAVYRVSSDWAELITWNNQPPFAVSPTDTISFDVAETGKWRSWNVTPNIDATAIGNGWVSWAIRYAPEDEPVFRTVGFASEEGGDVFAPYLKITYIVP